MMIIGKVDGRSRVRNVRFLEKQFKNKNILKLNEKMEAEKKDVVFSKFKYKHCPNLIRKSQC